MSERRALEQRYRRLLAWYPATHRAAYGEEMIGVLLACSPPSRRRPRFADAIDLVLGGLRCRLNPSRRYELAAPWPDVLAMLSLVAPALLAILAVPSLIGRLQLVMTAPWFMPRAAVVSAVTMLALVLPPLLALRGHRRTAATVAAAASAYFLSNGGYALMGLLGPDAEWLSFGAMLALEAVAIVLSPGPQHGRKILTTANWAIMVTALLIVAGFVMQRPVLRVPISDVLVNAVLVEPAVLVLTGVGLALTILRPLARRMLVLLIVPLYPYAVWVAFPTILYGGENLRLVYLPTLALTCAIGWFAVRSARRVGPGSSA